jgi:uncharacterized protein YkwD
VRRAGLFSPRVAENVARAYSPKEVERGLLDSPGHRANILSKEMNEVGIGVQMRVLPGQDGVRELFVTQLFRQAPEAFDAEQLSQQALLQVQGVRAAANLPKLLVDPALTDLARETATALSQGRLSEDRLGEPAHAALKTMEQRYRRLLTAMVATNDVKSWAPSPTLSDGKLSAIGLWTMPAAATDVKRQQNGSVYVVIVLAEPAAQAKEPKEPPKE